MVPSPEGPQGRPEDWSEVEREGPYWPLSWGFRPGRGNRSSRIDCSAGGTARVKSVREPSFPAAPGDTRSGDRLPPGWPEARAPR